MRYRTLFLVSILILIALVTANVFVSSQSPTRQIGEPGIPKH